MKYLYLFLSAFIVVLPMLWIDNYFITNSIWWTVVGAWHISRFVTLLEEEDND
jgi:hypothetical protein